MLIRIVKLSIVAEHIPDFELLFNEVQAYLENQPGFRSLELLQDINDPHVFFTYSKWDGIADLETYRASDFFAGVWSQVKTFFKEKPQVWSVNTKKHVEFKE